MLNNVIGVSQSLQKTNIRESKWSNESKMRNFGANIEVIVFYSIAYAYK